MDKETIDLIRELIPLLEGAGTGAFWLLLLLVLQGYAFIIAVLVGVAMVVKAVAEVIKAFTAGSRIADVLGFAGYEGTYEQHRDKLTRMVIDLRDKAERTEK